MITFRFEREEASIMPNKSIMCQQLKKDIKKWLKGNKITLIPCGVMACADTAKKYEKYNVSKFKRG